MSLHPYIAEMSFWQGSVLINDLYYGTHDLFDENPLYVKTYTAVLNSDIRMEHYRKLVDAGVILISTTQTGLNKIGWDRIRYCFLRIYASIWICVRA